MNFSKKVLLAALLSTLGFSSQVFAYSMGPYISAGAGGAFASVSDLLDVSNYTITSVAGRLGGGYLRSFSNDENPFFWGIEGNGNVYDITHAKALLFSADVSGIIGKQISDNIGVYGKVGISAYGDKKLIIGTGLPVVGVGVGYQFTDHLRATVEGDYTRFQTFGDTSIPIASGMVGLQYSF